GSAFKIVTAAAALEHGLITPNDFVDCENGEFNPYGKRIRDTHPLGVIPFWESFAYSSNIAIIKVAALLGEERMENWIRRFGFGVRTGVEMPGESAGIFRPREQWSGRSMGALPIGQEMAVNMLQLAQAFSAIANGGVLVKPYVVERAVSKSGETTYRHDPAPGRRILTEDTAEHMKMLCYAVVAGKDTTGRYAVISEYRAGGKTGTAQIARPDGKGYYHDRYTTIFAGFAPVRDPQLTCVIVVAEPMIPQHYGGYVCGPVFKEVMREALVRLNVPPDPMPTKHEVTNLALASAPTIPLVPMADADTVTPRPQFDAFEPVDLPRDALTLLPAANAPAVNVPVLPDFRGLTKWEAK
ncbi:MAG: penicillin-binding transpeptidase domain-containing protein, partial [Candidatus Hydrogenedentales bacterium]